MSTIADLKPQLNSVETMRDSVLFDGPKAHQKYTRFWLLLVLSSIIAAAGVVADSTATVIGAMIVAPLMTPIQGTMLSTVLGDRRNLIRAAGLVVAGALTAIAIGWVVGLLSVNDVVAATNSQVAGRVSPKLIDLLAALGTGVVGSIALIRKDIADTLPGVAIAISLVPPLSVVGLTLESGAVDESLGALLLFLTNVAAIIGTGIVVMAIYGAGRLSAPPVNLRVARSKRRNTIIVIAVVAVLIVTPLTLSTINSIKDTQRETKVHDITEKWAAEAGWSLETVTIANGVVLANVIGTPPLPKTADLKADLIAGGVDPAQVDVELVPAYHVSFDDD